MKGGDFPPLLAEGVQIAFDERCPVLGALPDELYALAGDPPAGVNVNDSVFLLLCGHVGLLSATNRPGPEPDVIRA